MRPKKAEFLNLLSTTEPDIVIGSETWLNPDIHSSELFPATYNVYRKDRRDGHGGVLIATKGSLISHEIHSGSTAESVLVSIKTTKKTEPLIIGSIYRTPSETSMEQMEEILKTLDPIKTDGTVWIGGDFNLPDIDWNDLKVVGHQYPRAVNQAFIDKITDVGLYQANDKPTRGDNILDLFLTNRPNLLTRCTTIPALGDHDIVLTDSKTKATRVKPVARKVSIWKKADFDTIKKSTVTFSEDNTTHPELTVNELWQRIQDHLTNMMNIHVPAKITSTKNHLPWINSKLKKISRRKYRAWRKAKTTNNAEDWARFKNIKNEARRTYRQSYQNYVNKIVEEDSNKNLWRLIKNKRSDPMGIAPLKKNGLTFSDSKAKADILNNHFCAAFTREDLSTVPKLDDSPHPDMPDILVQCNGVQKLLSNLNPKKAAGPDNIPCRLLKELASELAPVLTLLFNKSLATGDIPEIWKHAHVQPTFKKGDRNQPANYRPISLTCVCCKLLEHIVRSGISSHLDSNNIITDAQHGFRKKRSCESQLILTVDDLAAVIDKAGQTDTILLDFSKAFDTVPHQRLLLKLDYYGIRGQTKRWIENFLSGRTQQVVVEGESSCIGPVMSGVPQGSVLGPTLFLIFINDIGDGIHAKVRLFADDTILYSHIESPNDAIQLQDDLKKLETWVSKWQMAFNVDKCYLLSISRKRIRIPTSYTLHEHTLERVSDAKYLGVLITDNLNWGKHVQSTAAKANRTCAFIHRNLKGCSKRLQTHCYQSLARPILEYSSTVWDPHQQNLINTLEMTQRRAARRILQDFSPKTSASALVAKLHLDTLQHRRAASKATLMYKIMNGLVDMPIRQGVIEKVSRSTRGHQLKLRVPHARTDVYKHSFFPSAVRLWNSLDQASITATTVPAFKTSLENWTKDCSRHTKL